MNYPQPLVVFDTPTGTLRTVTIVGNITAGGITGIANVAAGTLRVVGNIGVNDLVSTIEIDGALDHDGTTAGFYDTAPVAKPTSVTARAALQALGLGATLTPDALVVNAQGGATYTLATADAGNLVFFNNAGAITLTVPTDAAQPMPTGTRIVIQAYATGLVTVAPAGGVTLNGTPGLKLRASFSRAELIKVAANNWVLSGDTAP
jgi:hypothetical protein